MPYKDKRAAFWKKVRVCLPDECWEWQRFCSPDGYGKCMYLGEQLAHRAAWVDFYEDIPAGLCVLHHCDNPKCCNPSHLFLGTRDDNMADRNAKGRQARGERNATAKLTRIQVEEIRRRYACGDVSQEALGAEYGVTGRNICDIVRNRIWR
jgi:hypothetical protein